MKRSIEWHLDCLRNAQLTYSKDYEQLQLKISALEKTKQYIIMYEQQINTAIAEGKSGFDPESYLKNRKMKGN